MAYQTILLKGNLEERYEEMRASGAITPGHLIKRHTDGTALVNSTAGAVAEMLFAHEDSLQGKTIDQAYASGDVVRHHVAQKGDVIYAWLAAGENAAVGAKLSSNGDGTFQVQSSTEATLAWAEQACDNSAGGAAARVVLRVA